MKKSLVKTTMILSRNIDMHPFPAGLTFEASSEVEKIMISAIESVEDEIDIKYLVGMEESDKEALLHEGVITYPMMLNRIHSSAIVVNDDFLYRLNDEDHLECVASTYDSNLMGLWAWLNDKEERLAPKLNFAYDAKLGYLTSRITEIGTGLKIHAVLHLPAIVKTGYLEKLFRAVHQVGYSIRAYGFGADNQQEGFFELSNSVTIGKTETELVEGINELIDRIEKKEADALETLVSAQNKVLEDELFRAYGVLKYARLLTQSEAVQLLSKVRLGAVLGHFKGLSIEEIDRLLFNMAGIGVQNQFGRKEDASRAAYIRAHLYEHQ